MAQTEDDDFARIVLAEGFSTREQIERCRRIQSSTDERLSLGQSLLREGFMTPEQYSRALVLLRQGSKRERDGAVLRNAERGLAEGRAAARQSQEDRVPGGIVVAEGCVSAEVLKVCLKEAATSGRSLAETLVALGHLESARVDALLCRLEMLELSCPSCKATLSVVRLQTAGLVRCPRCRNVVPQGTR